MAQRKVQITQLATDISKADIDSPALTGVPSIDRGIWMSAPPSSGSWARNAVVENNARSAGGYMGWVNVSTTSTPNWKGYGLIQT